MIRTHSLAKAILGSHLIEPGLISHSNGSISKGFEVEPLSSGVLEEGFEGGMSDTFFTKLSDLLTKLPNLFEGQILFCRRKNPSSGIGGFRSKIYFFEKVPNASGYSHLRAVLNELKLNVDSISTPSWKALFATILGDSVLSGRIPDFTWEKDSVRAGSRSVRALSMTELPQLTWKGCFQTLFESPDEFVLSIQIKIPDRSKVKKQLETKRRVSHALSISSSLEVRNIESNSVLSSSEETLERILVGKETLFEISVGIILTDHA